MIGGEQSKRSANLIRGEMEGTATALGAVGDGAAVGIEGGGGIRCSSTRTISHES